MISKLVRHSNITIIGYDIEFFILNLLSQSISDYDIEKNVEIFLFNVVIIDYNINLKKNL